MGDVRLIHAGPDPLEQYADLAGKGRKVGQIDAPPQHPGRHPGQPYADHYERTLELLRPGDLVCVDNVLWSGKVVDPAVSDADTLAIRAFNEKLADDARISLSRLSIADGLTLARKR